MPTLTIQTNDPQEVIDITDDVVEALADIDVPDGLCHLFALHTSVGMTVMDLDPGTDLDFLDAVRAMVPQLEYRHPHDPAHTGDHILSAIIGPSVTLPLRDSRLRLGTWQRIVLVELSGPRLREIQVTYVPAS